MSNQEIITLDLDQPGHRGVVIGQHEGQIVFVRGGLPGEKGVEVQLDRAKKPGKQRFRMGQALKVDQPSPHRVPGECDAAAAGAGCCDLDFVDATGSLDFKRDVVIDQFRRLAKFELPEAFLDEHVKATSLWPFTHYRTRVRLGVDKDGQPGLRKAKSNAIIPLAEAECAQWLPGLTDGLSGKKFTPNTEIVVGVGRDGKRSVVELKKTRRGRKRHVLEGSGTASHSHLGVSWDMPVEAFWQAHLSAAAYYARWVAERLQGASGSVWDLYGGAGALSAGLLGKVKSVDIVDVAGAATEAGKDAFAAAQDARDAGQGSGGVDTDVRFVSSDVGSWLENLDHVVDLDAVVLDPPRTGAGAEVIQTIAQHRPGRVVHIGCDPATAARDAGLWRDAGYDLQEMEIVDAFGLTHHVETLMYFEAAED